METITNIRPGQIIHIGEAVSIECLSVERDPTRRRWFARLRITNNGRTKLVEVEQPDQTDLTIPPKSL